jgi:putative DNA primase/helicase
VPEQTQIDVRCGEVDDKGRRLVIVTYGKGQHVDRFDPDVSFYRGKWRDECCRVLHLRGPWNASSGEDNSEIHAELESRLQSAIEAADATGQPKLLATPNIVTLGDVAPKPVTWFWDYYWPRGAITLLIGDPNEGKSTIAVDIVARHSRGLSMPPHSLPAAKPGNSLLLSAEDDLERTTLPRLIAAGGDPCRVHHMRDVTPWDGSEPRLFQLPNDIPVLEAAINEKKAELVVFDVFSAFVGEGLNQNADSDMRRLLSPLSAMAERTQAVVLLLAHMNKKTGTSSMYRAGGSIAIIGAARSAFAVAPNPEDPTEKVMVPLKHNLGPRPHSLTYCIESAGDVGRIAWGEQSSLQAADVLKGEHAGGSGGKGSAKTDHAKEIISELLADGPRGSNEVLTACIEAGLSERTYHVARKSLGIVSERVGFGSEGQWLLTLPAETAAYGEF